MRISVHTIGTNNEMTPLVMTHAVRAPRAKCVVGLQRTAALN